jgi:hypothetical protein
MLGEIKPSLLGTRVTTDQIKQVIKATCKRFPVLFIKPGSILPNDHADGNSSACKCANTSDQLFDRSLSSETPNTNLYQPRDDCGSSTNARAFLQRVEKDTGLDQVLLSDDSESPSSKVHATDLPKQTDREQMVSVRVGQPQFRQRLIAYWNGCSVTGCTLLAALRASHIKPWRDSTNTERLDVYNGLLLTAVRHFFCKFTLSVSFACECKVDLAGLPVVADLHCDCRNQT